MTVFEDAVPVKENIESAVRQRLHQSPYGELRRLRCSWHAGKLILRGPVSCYYLKQLAQQQVQGLVGVEAIDNRVTVCGRSNLWGSRDEFRSGRVV
jgi:hypothetical protein